MSDSLIFVLMFGAGIVALVKASDIFTDAAERLGLALGFPPFIIGVTILSIGTSLPELISSFFALSENVSEVVIGNVVGSNIANIFLVVGTAAVISKKGVNIAYDLVSVDLPLFVMPIYPQYDGWLPKKLQAVVKQWRATKLSHI
ncbi:MAG: hypothetical protein F6K16_35230 [Symploca sp. SIO2B6]|nr:hypothetical protein [Symploca sp. SIO2B6]